MSVAAPQLVEASASLTAVVTAGAPVTSQPAEAVELIGAVEHLRRLAAVAAVDAMQQIHASRTFYEHGHASARVMFAHVASVSGAEAHRLDKIRRMVATCDDIAASWRTGALSLDKAALLARAFANPRTRDRFLLEQRRFLKQARRFGFVGFERFVARWVEVNDQDGPDPAADPSHERRNLSLQQDYFSKAWKLDASLGSLAGSTFNETLSAYIEAEFLHDWAEAEKIHGAKTTRDHLVRIDTQRRADALCQMAADAVNSDKPSAPVKRVHNVVWNAETLEELLRRWVNAPARILDAGNYNISDIDGHPIDAGAAFADLLVSSFRRVVQNAAGVTIDLSTDARFFSGLARLGVMLATTECYWPGCHLPTSQCQIDHLRPAARGGPTNQLNGLPACKRHNRFKERGHTVKRESNGTITITSPTGERIR